MIVYHCGVVPVDLYNCDNNTRIVLMEGCIMVYVHMCIRIM
jgi:hypothetical protein